ncbi:unnamed protein product [Phytophthora lilii]|uniref:Unnamed protein product n=1 Tax=Phytophthora lilii TaxID=2077276 RepID=A0A9W7CPV8_9STRA|nr:unnamed protein product [Phytophthora lilii]
MKGVSLMQAAVVVVVAAHRAAASIDNPDVGEGYNFLLDTVKGATEKLVGTLSPNAPAVASSTQQGSTSGGYFTAFGTL